MKRSNASRYGALVSQLVEVVQTNDSDSKYCVRCGTPYVYAAAYVGHLGDYRCPHCGHARPPSNPT